MSSTDNHDGPRPTIGLPSRTRPPQPAPNRPVPPPATEMTAGQAMGPVATMEPEAPRRRLWAGRGGDVDELLEPDLSGSPRTTSSSGSDRPKVGQGELAATLGGLVFVLAGCCAWLVSRRGWELVPPDEDERLAMTDPIAAIVLRHSDGDWLNADVLDGIKASVAVTAYAQSGPLYRAERDTAETVTADDDLTPPSQGAF